jgi:hypothetical protein
MSSKDLDEILGLLLAVKDGASSRSNAPFDNLNLSFKANQDI